MAGHLDVHQLRAWDRGQPDPPVLLNEASRIDGPDRCLLCATPEHLIVERTDDLVVAAALSAKTAHELMLWPPRHTAQIDPAHGLLESLAGQVRRALRAFRSELGTPAFNLGLYVGPAGAPGFHWHMHLLPRPDVATMGGLEMTTGMILLAVSSDGTARLLRDALAEQLVA